MSTFRPGHAFPEEITKPLLEAWFSGMRKPSREESLPLQNRTGLSYEQVDRWFRNQHRNPPNPTLSSAKPPKSKPKAKTLPPSRKATGSTGKKTAFRGRQRRLSGSTKRHLEEWLAAAGREPNDNEARLLAEETGLDVDGVKSWFKHRTDDGQPSIDVLEGPAEAIDLSVSTDEYEPDSGQATSPGRPRVRSRRVDQRSREQELEQAKQRLEEENNRLHLRFEEKKRDFEEYLEIDRQLGILKAKEKSIDTERAELNARLAHLLTKNLIAVDGAACSSQPRLKGEQRGE